MLFNNVKNILFKQVYSNTNDAKTNTFVAYYKENVVNSMPRAIFKAKYTIITLSKIIFYFFNM